MFNRKFYIAALLIITGIGFIFNYHRLIKDKDVKLNNSKPQFIDVRYYDDERFALNIIRTRENPKHIPFQIRGAVIPHDMSAGYMALKVFERLKIQKTQTVILLGANHLEKGEYEALTSIKPWRTNFGILYPDVFSINKLLKYNIIHINDQVIADDTSISQVMPYLKYVLPEVKFIPIILSSFIDLAGIETFAGQIYSEIPGDTVILAAVDFSHYLSRKQADRNDQETLEIIRNRDYRRLSELESSHTDSVASLALLLKLMEKYKTLNLELIDHANSEEIFKQKSVSTTGYYSLVYY